MEGLERLPDTDLYTSEMRGRSCSSHPACWRLGGRASTALNPAFFDSRGLWCAVIAYSDRSIMRADIYLTYGDPHLSPRGSSTLADLW